MPSIPSTVSEYRGRRRAEPASAEASDAAPPARPVTRRQLLEQRRAAEQENDSGEVNDATGSASSTDSTGSGGSRHDSDSTDGRAAAVPLSQPPPQQRGGQPVHRATVRSAAPVRRYLRDLRDLRAPRLSAVALGLASVTGVAFGAGHALGAPPAQISSAAENAVGTLDLGQVAGAGVKGTVALPQEWPVVTTAAVAAALRLGHSEAPPVGLRASRSQYRPVLPGCSGVVTDRSYPNGHVPPSELCALTFAPGHHLRADAAVALAKLNMAYRDKFGHDLCLTDSYRSIAEQEHLAATKPALAARPGTSEHGMGLAVDLCGGIQTYDSTQYKWMHANAPAFGWENPDWAIPPSAREEPWHWEFVVGERHTTTADD